MFDAIWRPELQIRCVKITFTDSTCVISSPNPMFDHLLESSHRDDSNKWSNIEFGEEICILEMKIRTLSGALETILIIYLQTCSKSIPFVIVARIINLKL